MPFKKWCFTVQIILATPIMFSGLRRSQTSQNSSGNLLTGEMQPPEMQIHLNAAAFTEIQDPTAKQKRL
jgi:hypothetical protein